MSPRTGRSPERTAARSAPGDADAPAPHALRRSPESGPRILFLSGGSALRDLSRALVHYTHRSVHLITPFDSGGSSAVLRRAFGMPSVGDLRNRLLALARQDSPGVARIRDLLARRLDENGTAAELAARLSDLVAGHDPTIAAVAEPARARLRAALARFAGRMPEGFDLRGASLGNLVLAGAWLERRDTGAALGLLAELLEVRGRVLPTVDADLHLAARLADGTRVVGQHRLTGKSQPPIGSPVEQLELVERDAPDAAFAAVAAPEAVLAHIRAADLICFPMGSFYSSVVCHLLATGVGRAIAQARCPKVYVPSTGRDPELVGADPGRATELLLEALRADAGADVPAERLIDRVLLDRDPGVYARAPEWARVERLGIVATFADLVTPASRPRIDPDRLARALVGLALPEALPQAQADRHAARPPGGDR